jgi:hypothetical protein
VLEKKKWKRTSKGAPVKSGNYAIMYFKHEEFPLAQGFGYYLTVADSAEARLHHYPIEAKELQRETGWIDTFDDMGDPLPAELIRAYIGPIEFSDFKEK